MSPAPPSQSLVTWGELNGDPTKLKDLVGHPSSVFFDEGEFTAQLHNVAKHAIELGANGVAIEARYIDRDFVEDHSLYYSKSFHPYQNVCKRVHFFSGRVDNVRASLEGIVRGHASKGAADYREACHRFSGEHYLGFSVVRPLPGSPVGRTVLLPPKSDGSGAGSVIMPGERRYLVHLLGVELSVMGLAFQQQDLGVSACATTAIWSAMQKSRDFEDIASFSPATITTFASRYSQPFGRTLPAEEGLNIDQMCQAIQAIGVSPSLYRVTHAREARQYLHTAMRSGYVPILIATNGTVAHATAGVGMTLIGDAKVEPGEESSGWRSEASRVSTLFLHDDRIGPYMPATFYADATHAPCYRVKLPTGEEKWRITHILVPHHPKVRLSFAGLKWIATKILTAMTALYEFAVTLELISQCPPDVTYELYVEKSFRYVESLVLDGAAAEAIRLASTVSMPRYVAVVGVSTNDAGRIDVLIDTTDICRNVRCLDVLARGTPATLTDMIVQGLRTEFKLQ